MASVTALRELLAETSLPGDLVDEVLAETNTLWLLGVPDEMVASELVLCHPALGPGEVRAVVNQTDHPRMWRVTVVTRDRPGLLAGTAGTLAEAGFSIVDASVTVLLKSRLCLQRMTIAAAGGAVPDDTYWNQLGRSLRDNLQSGATPIPAGFLPRPRVVVEAQPQDLGRTVVTVEAPDQVGLLHAAASWMEAAGCNVEAARAGREGDRAHDVFIVTGAVDTGALATALGGEAHGSFVTTVVTTPLHMGVGVLQRASGLACGVVTTIAGAFGIRSRTATRP